MDDSSSNDARHEGDPNDQPQQHGEQDDAGHSGEGAASALAHMKSQVKQHRHQTGEADDAAGSQGHGQ